MDSRRLAEIGVVVLAVLAPAFARAEPDGAKDSAPRAMASPASAAPLLVTSRLVREAVRVALRAAGHPGVRQKLEGMASRARAAGLAPEVWLRGARSTNDLLRMSPTVDDPYHYSATGGIGYAIEARLVWHLDRLVFDREEIAVERLRAEREGDAAKLTRAVVTTLFDWQRADLRLRDPTYAQDELNAALLERAEAQAILDLLTEGWFTEEIARLRARR
jgi:hypothetical protein